MDAESTSLAQCTHRHPPATTTTIVWSCQSFEPYTTTGAAEAPETRLTARIPADVEGTKTQRLRARRGQRASLDEPSVAAQTAQSAQQRAQTREERATNLGGVTSAYPLVTKQSHHHGSSG